MERTERAGPRCSYQCALDATNEFVAGLGNIDSSVPTLCTDGNILHGLLQMLTGSVWTERYPRLAWYRNSVVRGMGHHFSQRCGRQA